jgi:Tfp pilus assembly PilM family ATPase
VARSRLLVAFDASAVAGARLSRGLGGLRLALAARMPLPEGALVPEAVEANLRRPDAVIEALRHLRDALGGRDGRATLILPDGVARMQLLELSPGAAPQDLARFRLAPNLPYAPSEAIVDTMALGRDRALAAAVRRGVVEAYEGAAAAAGFAQERVDLAPLAALASLFRRADGAHRVDAVLGDAAYSLAAFSGGAAVLFRTRRREAGADEARRIADEIARTADLAALGARPHVRAVGPGALALVSYLSGAGWQAAPGWEAERDGLPLPAAELPWLGPALG